MTLIQTVTPISTSSEFYFAGDEVRLAAQVDYPAGEPPPNGFPLLLVLHHAGLNTREDYAIYAEMALASGFAVFRWDKRGAGRSGACGRGSATQDAVLAWDVALSQDMINRKQAVILAFGSGTALLGDSFGLFARIQRPAGVLLVANMLDDKRILALDTRIQILLGDGDWNPWEIYGQAACAAHAAHYPHGASYYVARDADRLLVPRDLRLDVHPGARKVIRTWLESFTHSSR